MRCRWTTLFIAVVLVAEPACGDEPPGETGGPICRDGLRLSLEVDGDRGTAVRIASIDEAELATRQPYVPGSGRTFSSSHWAPDGRTVALSRPLDESAVADTRCEPFETSPVAGFVVSFSPDGGQLLLTQVAEVDGRARVDHVVVRVDGAELGDPVTLSSFDVAPAEGSYSYSAEASWSPDSNRVAIAVTTEEELEDDLPGHLYLVQADAIEPEAVEIGEVFSGESVAWSPDGRAIAFRDIDPGVLVVDVADIETVYRIDEDQISCQFGETLPTGRFVWAPSSGAFLYGAQPLDASEPCALREVRLDSDEAPFATRTLPDSSAALRPAWFRDSRHVVHVSGDGRSLLWSDPQEFTSTPIAGADGDAGILEFAFSPASDRVAVLRGPADGSAELLIAATPGEPPDLATKAAVVQTSIIDMIHWAPKGDRLVITGPQGAHVVLPDEVAALDALQAGWSPDSRYLALLQDGDVVVYLASDSAVLADGRVAAHNANRFTWAPLP